MTELFLLSVIRSLIVDTEAAVILVIMCNSPIVLLALARYRKKLWGPLTIGYLLRLSSALWDYFGRNIFTLPGSGGDTELFYHTATLLASDLSLLKEHIYGGLYTKMLAVLFRYTFPNRLLGQYLNVLVGFTIIIVVYRTLRMLDVSDRTVQISVCIIALFPNAVIISGILLRDSLASLAVVASFYYHIKWYRSESIVNAILSMLVLAFGSILHAGVAGIAVGYLFMFMFYKRSTDSLEFSPRSVAVFVFTVLLGAVLITQYRSLFFAKFSDVETIEDVYNTANSRIGGSAYLVNLRIDSYWKFALYSPIKMFYFLASPLPTEWRRMSDVAAFIADGLVYLLVTLKSLIDLKKVSRKTPVIVGVIIMLLSVVLIFGVGVSNSGTAMRHRLKILPLIVALHAIIVDQPRACRKQGRRYTPIVIRHI